MTLRRSDYSEARMLFTGTAIEHRDGVAAVVPAVAGVNRIVDGSGERQARLAAERALDEVLADSFPASDPPSWNSGIIQPHPARGFASSAAPAQNGHERLRRADVIDVSRSTQGDRTFFHALVSLCGAAGIALAFGVGILLVGLPLVLVVRGVLEAAGWLFGIDVR
jgi:hypothetical protein